MYPTTLLVAALAAFHATAAAVPEGTDAVVVTSSPMDIDKRDRGELRGKPHAYYVICNPGRKNCGPVNCIPKDATCCRSIPAQFRVVFCPKWGRCKHHEANDKFTCI